MSLTNETTKDILNFLFRERVFAYRNNSVGIPDIRKGILRPASKTGLPDIIAVLSSRWVYLGPDATRIPCAGTYFGIEIKTGRDRLSDVQVGTHINIRGSEGIVFVVKDYEDFLNQWNQNICQK